VVFWIDLDELLQKVLQFKAIGLLRKEFATWFYIIRLRKVIEVHTCFI